MASVTVTDEILAAYDPMRFITEEPDFSVPYDIPISALESKVAARLAEAFFFAVAAVKVLDWTKFGQGWVKTGFDRRAFEQVVSRHFLLNFLEKAVPALTDAALAGRKVAAEELGLSATDYATHVGPWAVVTARRVGEQVLKTSNDALQGQANEVLNLRLPAPVVAERLNAVYGLDERDANAYQTYISRKALPRNTSLPETLLKRLALRGRLIGDTEAFSAINFGRQLYYMEGVFTGALRQDTQKVWVTALDERVCPVCRPMDGLAVPVDKQFEVVFPPPRTKRGKKRANAKLFVPPVHPNCRCTVVLDEKFRSGIITRSARYDDDERHRARLVSDVRDLVLA